MSLVAFSALHSCHNDLTIINVQEVMRYLMWPVASAGGQSSRDTRTAVLQQSLNFHTEERNGQTSENETCLREVSVQIMSLVNTMLQGTQFFDGQAENNK